MAAIVGDFYNSDFTFRQNFDMVMQITCCLKKLQENRNLEEVKNEKSTEDWPDHQALVWLYVR